MTLDARPDAPLPDVLTGPLLRRITPQRLVIWLVGSRCLDMKLLLHPAGHPPRRLTLNADRVRRLPLGRHAWLHLIDVPLATPLPAGVVIDYDLMLTDADADGASAGIAA